MSGDRATADGAPNPGIVSAVEAETEVRAPVGLPPGHTIERTDGGTTFVRADALRADGPRNVRQRNGGLRADDQGDHPTDPAEREADGRHPDPRDRHPDPRDRHPDPGDRHPDPGDRRADPGDPGDRHADPGGDRRDHAGDSADGRADDRTAVLLVHGWTVTADTTFAPCYTALADRYRVVAPDLRGHGRSSPVRGRVRLEDLADDCATVLDALAVERAVVVGYSLGGAVAQLLWQRHRDRVAGLVLCSTARHFQTGPVGDLWYRGQAWIAPAVRAFPGPARARMQRAVDGEVAAGPYADWYRRELLRGDPPSLLRVGAALGRFRSNRWIGEVDVPAAAIVTTEDRTVPSRRQRGLAAAIPGCRTYEVAGPHNSAVSIPDVWVPALRRALDDLT